MRANLIRWTVGLGLLGVLVGCGSGGFQPVGTVTVSGITTPIQACIAEPIDLTGDNFLSEHGIHVIVRFVATSGTPFEGGTSAAVEVTGLVTSNTTIELVSPLATEPAEATVTVVLPGGASGSSVAGLAKIVGGTLGDPVANPDDYTTVGNVLLSVPAPTGVLVNDLPGGCNPDQPTVGLVANGAAPRQIGLTVVSADTTSALGGDVAVNDDGSFTYNPPVGIEGLDTFEYTMTDGDGFATTTVRIQIVEMVWFIDDMAPGGGDGRFTTPLNSLDAFNMIQGGAGDAFPGPGDHIFVYEGSGNPYDGGIRLLDQQLLIGQGIDLVVAGFHLVTATSQPQLTNTGAAIGDQIGAPCIVLGNENTVRGLIVHEPTGDGIVGTDVAGPTTIDQVIVRGAGSLGVPVLVFQSEGGAAGIALRGTCTGTFTCGMDVLVENCAGPCVEVSSFASGFAGTFTYHGDIDQPSGAAIQAWGTEPGSSLVFRDGTVHVGGNLFTYAGIDLYDVQGGFACHSPTTVEGQPYRGIAVGFSAGTFTFENVTMTFADGGTSSAGVELYSVGGGTFTFDDLDVTIAGDPMADFGGIPFLIQNFGQTPQLQGPAALVTPTTINVLGDSSLAVEDGEEALRALGSIDEPIQWNATWNDISSMRNPRGGGVVLQDCLGTFAVTGTITVHDVVWRCVEVFRSTADFTIAAVDLANVFDEAFGVGIALFDGTGAFDVLSGSITNLWAEACTVDDARLSLAGVTISDASRAVNLNGIFSAVGSTLAMNDCAVSSVGTVVELNGTCTLSGSGNTASGFGTLCQDNASTPTGSISFGAAGTCP